MRLTLKQYGTVYFALTLLHLTILYFDQHTLHMIVKPLFMPLLMVMVYQHTSDRKKTFYRLMQFGLFFSWLGDIALMIDRNDPNLFIAGLLFFLIAHVGYAAAFIGSIRRSMAPFEPAKAALIALPFVVFTALFFGMMKDGLGEMFVPVLAYTTVITIMGIAAALRLGHAPDDNYKVILTGAVLFILSDCVIAWNKFMVDFPHDQILNMSLYLTGQFLLAYGAVKYLTTTPSNAH